MILRDLKERSIFDGLFRNLWRGYRLFELQLDEAYKSSQTYKIIKGLLYRVKTYFRYSFLGRVTELKKKENIAVLNESAAVRCIINWYKELKPRGMAYVKTSRIRSSVHELIKGLSIKDLSIVIVTAISANIFFSVLLIKREIGILGWIMRGALLFIGSAGLLCNLTWEDIKKTSYFLNRIT